MKHLTFYLVAAILLAGCSAPAAPAATPITPAPLVPFATRTPTLPPAQDAPTPAHLPTPTPTPRIHVLKGSDTLFGLAWLYGVSLEDLLAANPGIQPNALSVGATVVIPPSVSTPQAAQPIPPITLSGVPDCYPTSDGGAWCFLVVTNTLDKPLESVSAAFTLPDAVSGQSATQTAITPLNLIPPGSQLPLMAFFPPPVQQAGEPGATLVNAFTPADTAARYLTVDVQDIQTMIAADELSARVTGTAAMASVPDRLWVVAVAYAGEHVVGVRRFDFDASAASQQFDFTVFSMAGAITQVDILAEAQP
jgi:hypothetical protein